MLPDPTKRGDPKSAVASSAVRFSLVPVVKPPAKELENSGAGVGPVGIDDQVGRVRCHVAQSRRQVLCVHRLLRVLQTEASLCRFAGKAWKIVENADGRDHLILAPGRIDRDPPSKRSSVPTEMPPSASAPMVLVLVEANLASNRAVLCNADLIPVSNSDGDPVGVMALLDQSVVGQDHAQASASRHGFQSDDTAFLQTRPGRS